AGQPVEGAGVPREHARQRPRPRLLQHNGGRFRGTDLSERKRELLIEASGLAEPDIAIRVELLHTEQLILRLACAFEPRHRAPLAWSSHVTRLEWSSSSNASDARPRAASSRMRG